MSKTDGVFSDRFIVTGLIPCRDGEFDYINKKVCSISDIAMLLTFLADSEDKHYFIEIRKY